jgi:lauroyl/myristoyl acyltransferase
MVSRSSSAPAVATVLDQGLVLLFGRPLRPRANLVDAVRFALASGAAAIPAYAEGLRGARFVVNFLPPIDFVPPQSDKPEALLENVRRLDRLITPIILTRLDQWFWMPHLRLD